MTDTIGIDPEFYLDYFDHPGWVSPLKETTSTEKEIIKLLLEVKTKAYYGLRTMEK